MWSEQHLGVKCQRPDWVTDVCDRRILQVQLRGRFSRRLESDLSDGRRLESDLSGVKMVGMSTKNIKENTPCNLAKPLPTCSRSIH